MTGLPSHTRVSLPAFICLLHLAKVAQGAQEQDAGNTEHAGTDVAEAIPTRIRVKGSSENFM